MILQNNQNYFLHDFGNFIIISSKPKFYRLTWYFSIALNEFSSNSRYFGKQLILSAKPCKCEWLLHLPSDCNLVCVELIFLGFCIWLEEFGMIPSWELPNFSKFAMISAKLTKQISALLPKYLIMILPRNRRNERSWQKYSRSCQ